MTIPFSPEDDALGRAKYEAFYEATRAWQPYPLDWEKQAATVKQGWITAAKKVRNVAASSSGPAEFGPSST